MFVGLGNTRKLVCICYVARYNMYSPGKRTRAAAVILYRANRYATIVCVMGVLVEILS